MESQTEVGKLWEREDKRDEAGGDWTEVKLCLTHTLTCAHTHRFFFSPPQVHTLLNTITHAGTRTLTFLQDADRSREREVWYPPRRFFSPRSLFLFLNPPFLPFLFHRRTHTCSHCLPPFTPSSFSSSFSLKNKTYCCTCREAARLVFSLFCFFHPPGSESCQLWPLLKGCQRERERERTIDTGGWK